MPLLAVSDAIGLSSGSRLYDHFVQLEAVTPSEHKNAGRGLVISYGMHETSFGKTFLATTARGICKLAFCDDDDDCDTLAGELTRDWPRAEIAEDAPQTSKLVPQLFAGAGLFRKNTSEEIELKKPLSVFVRGTNFQIAVWRALLSIPPGTLTSYGQIARLVGKPTSSRAVGTAVGANPVSLLIPCHRVIQQSGRIGGYRWGLTRKHAMHAMETARREVAE
jgi:AraC family transcriptional regulator, regulatory protein of adaptative response / methylated-DNA-[protein]-cysteine methyltransferase